jgi:hypothetical protein
MSELMQQVMDMEERLRQAMLASDCAVLDELVSPELVFTNHMGQALDKQQDLDLHRSGVLRLDRMEPSEVSLRLGAQCAVVSVRMQVAGAYDGMAFQEDLRYTRVWEPAGAGRWRVLAGHASRVHAWPAAGPTEGHGQPCRRLLEPTPRLPPTSCAPP